MLSDQLRTSHEFAARHIGPRPDDVQSMLKDLNLKDLEDLAAQAVPASIRTKKAYDLGEGVSEHDLLRRLKATMGKNKVMRSLIGLGYADTITPTVIQRNILENPVWYTAYTPYQAEIAQGRLEALLNFQTMVKDLTGMEIANASLLDEGTAAAEAMAMAHAVVAAKKPKAASFVVSPSLHPQVIEVLQTRAEPLGWKMILSEPELFRGDEEVFAFFIAYPDTDGLLKNSARDAARIAHDRGALLVATVDLLAMTLLSPPGDWGADIVVGNSQRFGVPLGYGGPHAAFMATKDAYKRLMPGRIVGVSQDARGKQALRLALQTREQHIRREKATSNICTAQVLLANMASMYAVYHGPEGLRRIARRIHLLTTMVAEGLRRLGLQVTEEPFFDTLKVTTDKLPSIVAETEKLGLNFRLKDARTLTLTMDETCDVETVLDVLASFNGGRRPDFIVSEDQCAMKAVWPEGLLRKTPFLTHAVFNSHHSETELLRYIHRLQNKDVTLTHSMIPLGSCTMKLNATTELVPVSWPEISRLHPFAPVAQTQGMLEMIRDLEGKLADLTGFAAVSLQPNAGSQGEYAGLLVIRKYHHSRGDTQRDVCLIPSSAHGTNPASAAMAGLKVVVVNCDDQGNVDIPDLRAKAEQHKDRLAALMVTYPSTHGVFEEGITEICQIVHDFGGQVYMDGANMNALVGLCRPGEFGADVSHLNLHKTFAIPHGGGGPGVGPIGVREHLKPFLPKHSLVAEAGPKTGISSTTSAPWGSAGILPISWAYVTMMGAEGLRQATLVSILNANYIAKKLEPHYPILYRGKNGWVAHECIIDLRGLKKTSGIDVADVAKRLIDFGFHAPTMSWPVAGTLMIEPTESESKAELDRFIQAMITIREEIRQVEKGAWKLEDNPLVNSPHTMDECVASEWKHAYPRETAAFPLPYVKEGKIWPPVSRVDNAYGDRNLVCECPPLEAYR